MTLRESDILGLVEDAALLDELPASVSTWPSAFDVVVDAVDPFPIPLAQSPFVSPALLTVKHWAYQPVGGAAPVPNKQSVNPNGCNEAMEYPQYARHEMPQDVGSDAAVEGDVMLWRGVVQQEVIFDATVRRYGLNPQTCVVAVPFWVMLKGPEGERSMAERLEKDGGVAALQLDIFAIDVDRAMSNDV